MSIVKKIGRSIAILAGAASIWAIIFASTGSALLKPDPSVQALIGRGHLAFIVATLVIPFALDKLDRAKRFLVSWAALSVGYVIALSLRPDAMPAGGHATAWCSYGLVVALLTAIIYCLFPRSEMQP